MPEDILWTLAADGEPTVAAFDQIDAAASAMGDAVAQSVAAMTEEIATLTESLTELGAMADENAGMITGMSESMNAMGAASAEDTALISALNDTIVNLEAQISALTLEMTAAADATRATGAAAVESAASQKAAAAAAAAHKQAMNDLQDAAGKLIDKLKMVAEVAGILGAVVVGVSVKMAGDFQSNITKLYTTAGEAHNNLQMVGDGILNMSSQVGTGALKLSEAMYWIESGGLHGAKALEAERIAAEAAKAENANLDKVSVALAASLNAYAGSGMTAVQAMNTLTASTGQGMMTFEQLSGSLASVLPASAKFHISLTDVTAALADMTAQGDPAEQAATHLKQVILALEAPSKIGAASLKAVGLTSTEVADEMKVSLPGALKMITDAVGKKFPEGSAAYNQAIKNIAGGSKQMMGFLELTGAHMGVFVDNVHKISGAVQQGGNNLMGWSDIQGNFNFKMDQARAVIESVMIKLGTGLLPILGNLLSSMTPVIASFGDWLTSGNNLQNAINAIVGAITTMVNVGTAIVSFFQNNQVAVYGLVAVLGMAAGIIAGALVAAFVAWATAAWAAAAATIAATWPFLLIGAVIGLVVIGIILAIQHWGAISTWLTAQWNTVSGFFSDLWSGVVGNFNSAKDSIGSAINSVVGFFNSIKTPVEVAAGIITGFFLPAMIKAGTEAVINGAKITANFVSSMVKTGSEAAINGAKTSAQFVASMVKSGAEAVINGAKVTAQFVASMIKAGAEAVVNGAKITAQFVASIVKSGVEGWQAAGKLAIMVAQYIASGVQAALAGAKIAAQFVASIVKSGVEAAIAGAKMLASLVPAIISVATEGIIAAATAIPGLIIGFIGWAAAAGAAAIATLLAAWPILLIIAAIALLVVGIYLLITHWKQVSAWLQGAWHTIATTAASVWHAITQFISSAVGAVIKWITSKWQSVIGWIVGRWTYLKEMAEVYFMMIYVTIQAKIQQVEQFIRDVWNRILGTVHQLWDDIVGVFSDAWNKLIVPLGQLEMKAINWFLSLAGKAITWGEDIIKNLISGITNQIGNLENTVSGVANKIKQFLGFSKPELGPLADADQYMPDFIELMSRGLEGNTGRLKQALSTVAGSMSANISPNVTMPGASGTSSLSGGGSTAVFYQILQVLQQIQQQQRGGGSNNISNVQNNQFNGGGGQGAQELYNLFNQMAGQQFESGLRGSY